MKFSPFEKLLSVISLPISIGMTSKIVQYTWEEGLYAIVIFRKSNWQYITISIEPSNEDGGGGGGGVATDDVDDGGSILVERDSKSIFCDLPVNELNMI